MRIRFTRAGVALAAGVAATAMLSLPAASASTVSHTPRKIITNATNACDDDCTDVSFQTPGPLAILGVHSGGAYQNNLVRLLPGSNGASKEDFTEINVGKVFPLYCTPFGAAQVGSLFTPRQCQLLFSAGLLGATTFQLAFNPNDGGDETLCIGTWDNNTPVTGGKLRLVPCGQAADTVLIATATLPTGTTTDKTEWLVNGGSDNFSNPVVATSDGTYPSQVTWSTVRVNSGLGIDTQETVGTPGPFSSVIS